MSYTIRETFEVVRQSAIANLICPECKRAYAKTVTETWRKNPYHVWSETRAKRQEEANAKAKQLEATNNTLCHSCEIKASDFYGVKVLYHPYKNQLIAYVVDRVNKETITVHHPDNPSQKEKVDKYAIDQPGGVWGYFTEPLPILERLVAYYANQKDQLAQSENAFAALLKEAQSADQP